MPTESPSRETLLGLKLTRATECTFWAPRYALLFAEYSLSTDCVPGSMLGTRIHKRWLQTLVQRPLTQKRAGLETTPIAQERPRETRRGPGLACSRSLGQEVSGWDVSPETTGHRAFAKRDKSPRGNKRVWDPSFTPCRLPFTHRAGRGHTGRHHPEWRGPVTLGGAPLQPREPGHGWRLVQDKERVSALSYLGWCHRRTTCLWPLSPGCRAVGSASPARVPSWVSRSIQWGAMTLLPGLGSLCTSVSSVGMLAGPLGTLVNPTQTAADSPGSAIPYPLPCTRSDSIRTKLTRGLCRCNQIKMRSHRIRVALDPMAGSFISRGKPELRDTQGEGL